MKLSYLSLTLATLFISPAFSLEKSLPLKSLDKVQSIVCLATKSIPELGEEMGTINSAPRHAFTFIKKDTIGKGGKKLGNFILNEMEISPENKEIISKTDTAQIFNFSLDQKTQELHFAFIADWKASGWLKLEEKTYTDDKGKKFVFDIIAKGMIEQKETQHLLSCVLSFN
jgi:hypothetical protein